MIKAFLLLFLCIHLPAIENDLNRLFSELAAKLPSQSSITMAVFPFSVAAPGTSPAAGAMVAEYAVAFFSTQPSFKVVERGQYRRVAEELALSQTGVIDEGRALEAGKLLAAEYLLTGSINEAMGKRLISARLVRTETGEVAASGVVTTDAGQLDAFYRDALGEKAGVSGTVLRSVVLPGWGQFYTDHPVRGGVFLGLAALSAGALVWAILNYSDKADVVTSFDEGRNVVSGETPAEYGMRKQEAISDKNGAGTAVNVSIGVLAGVWIVNGVDAAICGKQQAKRVKTLYFSKE